MSPGTMLYCGDALRVVAAVDYDLERRRRAGERRQRPGRGRGQRVAAELAQTAASAVPVAVGSVASASTRIDGPFAAQQTRG